ncbi:DUF2780 domain-containing protein [Marinobacter mobilis]|uniref:DUF2780 domain-containing protein n=1 Tax=Marinobacter mobilis TaxID=488533 RepID=UPI0035C6A62B
MNSILKRFLLVSSFYLLTPAASAFDFSESLRAGSDALSATSQVSGDAQLLMGQLQGGLGVTESQAMGGTSALLQLAQNSLGADAMTGLTDQVSGLNGLLGASTGAGLGKSLLGSVTSMEGVEQAFRAIGLDAGMVQQFAPMVLDFLANQGVAAGLLGSLGSLWSPTV